MRIKLRDLDGVVKRAVSEDNALNFICEQFKRAFPVLVLRGSTETRARELNDHVTMLESRGKLRLLETIDKQVVDKFANSTHTELRKLAARLSENVAVVGALLRDKSSAVRAHAARRAPIKLVESASNTFSFDDELRSILATRKRELLCEDVDTELEEVEKMGDAAKQQDLLELSDGWYEDKARELIADYGRVLDTGWERRAVKSFCDHSKATSGVLVDAEKLYDAVKEQLETAEDERLKELSPLKEMARSLLASSKLIVERGEPEPHIPPNPVKELLTANLSTHEFAKRASAFFAVQEAAVPGALKKHRLGEISSGFTVPVKGRLPRAGGLTSEVERALDKFCEAWNRKTAQAGEPVRIDWSPDPQDITSVSFRAVLK